MSLRPKAGNRLCFRCNGQIGRALFRVGEEFTQEDVMNKRLIVLTLAALAGVAGVANAQTYDPSMTRGERREEMREERRLNERHPVAFKDEYGFRYDAQGDRLDANGNVMPPPVTPPGTPALR
jgi:hypothetical protein